MSRLLLTDAALKRLKPPAGNQRDYWDTVIPNFGVRLTNAGTKSFVVLMGSGARKVIGRYPILSLAQARAEAKRLLAERTLGNYRAPTISFPEALELFLTTHCQQNNRPGTAKETTRLLRKHFLPKLRHQTLEKVTPQNIGWE